MLLEHTVAKDISCLPSEVMQHVLVMLDDLRDIVALKLTSKAIHSICCSMSPANLLIAASKAHCQMFQPAPYFLIAVVAKDLRVWLSKHPEATSDLQTAIQGGSWSLMEFCFGRTRLTWQHIADIHRFRTAIMEPAAELIASAAGRKMPEVPDPTATRGHLTCTIGGSQDCVIDDSMRSLLQLAIYGDLFGGRDEFEAFLNCSALDTTRKTNPSTEALEPLIPVETRLDFVKYCVPDIACFWLRDFIESKGLPAQYMFPSTLRFVLRAGPYQDHDDRGAVGESVRSTNDQRGLLLLLESRGWNDAWSTVRDSIGRRHTLMDGNESRLWYLDTPQNWKELLWCNLSMMQGLAGFEMLFPDRHQEWNKWEALFTGWRDKLAAIEHQPRMYRCGWRRTFGFPFLLGDLKICIGPWWQERPQIY